MLFTEVLQCEESVIVEIYMLCYNVFRPDVSPPRAVLSEHPSSQTLFGTDILHAPALTTSVPAAVLLPSLPSLPLRPHQVDK